MNNPHKDTFGVRLPNSGPQASAQSMLQVAQEIEALGFDSTWVHDHLTWSDEIHRRHISSGSDDSHTGNASPEFFEAFERMMSTEPLAAVSLIGSPEEIRRQVKAYSDRGVSHFEIKFIYPNLERHSEMLRPFVREVLAAFT